MTLNITYLVNKVFILSLYSSKVEQNTVNICVRCSIHLKGEGLNVKIKPFATLG